MDFGTAIEIIMEILSLIGDSEVAKGVAELVSDALGWIEEKHALLFLTFTIKLLMILLPLML